MEIASRRSTSRLTKITGALMILLAFGTRPVFAQEFRWPDNPKNIKVLGDDITGTRLGQVMRGFATALGVRCQYCHVGDGPNLAEFDFESDEKLTKQKARIMIQMVQDLNSNYIPQLTELESVPTRKEEVTCLTCHRTQNKPVMLDDLLERLVNSSGVDAAIEKYRELREENYGGFAYNFGPETLTGLGERLGRLGQYEAGIRFLQLEIEMNGETPSVYYTLGGVQAQAELTEEAVESFEKGMAMAPEGWKPFFQAEIDRLQEN